jgi:hypothetical protein
MKTGIACALVVALVTACAHSERPADAAISSRAGARPSATSSTCPPAPGGIVVSFDKVAYFPARARMSDLERFCPAAGDTMYDAVGWQAAGKKFPFVGATLVAIHSGNQPDSIPLDEPDMWTASGDSVRLPNGQLLPRTLGALRALGQTTVSDNEGGYDDWDGPGARTCRFPEILFNLDGTGLPKTLPDSARVTSIEIDVRHPEVWRKFCAGRTP